MIRYVIAMLLLSIACHCNGQEILMPGGKSLPTMPLKKANRVRLGWVASDTARPSVEPKDGSRAVPGSAVFEFMETVPLMYEYQGSDGNYILIGRYEIGGTVRPRGWVRRDLMVTKQHALRVPIPAATNDSGSIKPSSSVSNLYQKVRLSNTNRSLKKALDQGVADVSGVPVTRSPEAGAKVVSTYKLATLFFVYGETEDYLLIGRRENFTDEQDKRNIDADASKDGLYKLNSIRGWIPRERVVRWNTRQALSWNWWSTAPNAIDRRTEAGLVFRVDRPIDGKLVFDGDATADLAEEYVGGKDIKGDFGFSERFVKISDSIGTGSRKRRIRDVLQVLPSHVRTKTASSVAPDTLLVSRPFEASMTRHPILADAKYYEDHQNFLYHVGYSGGFSNGSFDKQEFEQKMAIAIDATKQLDLMILVDQTTSMKRYFPAVANAVALICHGATGNPDRSVRVSVSYYGDQEVSGKAAFEINPLRAIATGENVTRNESFIREYLRLISSSASEERFREFFKSAPTSEGSILRILGETHFHHFQSGGDPLEDVFQGVANACTAKFRPHAQKLMIVIGDRGDKSEEGRKTGDSKVQRLASLLDSNIGTNTRLFAINVDDEGHVEADLFSKQMEMLTSELNLRSGDNVSGVIEGEDRAQNVANLIKEQYDRMVNRANEMNRRLLTIAEGDFKNEIGPAVRRLLESVGVNPDDLRKLKGGEIFAEGYVWQYSKQSRGLQQVRVEVLLEEDELIRLINGIDESFGKKIIENGVGRDVFKSIALAIQQNAGQSDGATTVSEMIELGLDLPMQTPLMTMTPTRIRERIKTDKGVAEMERELETIQLKLQRLKDICERDVDKIGAPRKLGYRADWYMKEAKTKNNVPYRTPGYNSRVQESRAFSFLNDESGTRWYWIDLLEEFP